VWTGKARVLVSPSPKVQNHSLAASVGLYLVLPYGEAAPGEACTEVLVDEPRCPGQQE
jgi:hypothetical protein